MKYKDAYPIAEKIIDEISPFCYRCEVAGSIRREKSEVKDIEIVAIPKPFFAGFFEEKIGRQGIMEVTDQWQLVKGKMAYGKTKYTQWVIPEGYIEGSKAIKLDLFFAKRENWGLTLATRTGSAEYSHRVLACGWVKAGYNSKGNMLYKDEEAIEIPEEIDLFRLIGRPYVHPRFRC